MKCCQAVTVSPQAQRAEGICFKTPAVQILQKFSQLMVKIPLAKKRAMRYNSWD